MSSDGTKRNTIRDVARLSGVSAATVSHVINGTRFVSDETRERVMDAITALHYTPSALARSLSTRVTHSLGVVVSDITNPFFTSVVRSIGDYTRQRGYTLTVCNTDANIRQEQTVVQALLAKQVDGLIIAPIDPDAQHFLEIIHKGTPLVFIDRGLAPSVASTVCVDNRQGTRDAIEHLIADGHQKIAIILGRQSLPTSHERLQGYYDALDANNIPRDNDLIVWSNSRLTGGFQATEELLAKSVRPTAIFAGNNQMTLGSLHALQSAGIDVPDGMAIIGFDDHDWAPIFTPPLTVVSQPTIEIGYLAVECIFRSMENAQGKPEIIRLPAQVIVRGSCSRRCLERFRSAKPSRNFGAG